MAMRSKYDEGFQALDPFAIIQEGLTGLVDGEHFFDAFAEDATFESRYDFPGWPRTILASRASAKSEMSSTNDERSSQNSGRTARCAWRTARSSWRDSRCGERASPHSKRTARCCESQARFSGPGRAK
jgi:hypothetical protein